MGWTKQWHAECDKCHFKTKFHNKGTAIQEGWLDYSSYCLLCPNCAANYNKLVDNFKRDTDKFLFEEYHEKRR